MNSNWLAGPGQFWILGVSWSVVALFFVVISWKLGKIIRSETDGCLLVFSNLLLTTVGAMGGLAVFRFPFNLLTSMFACLLLPSAATFVWYRRTSPR